MEFARDLLSKQVEIEGGKRQKKSLDLSEKWRGSKCIGNFL